MQAYAGNDGTAGDDDYPGNMALDACYLVLRYAVYRLISLSTLAKRVAPSSTAFPWWHYASTDHGAKANHIYDTELLRLVTPLPPIGMPWHCHFLKSPTGLPEQNRAGEAIFRIGIGGIH